MVKSYDKITQFLAAFSKESVPELPRDARQLVLEDRAVRDLHLALLSGTPQPDQDARLGVLRAQAAQRETAGFSREDWTLLLSDSEGLRSLP